MKKKYYDFFLLSLFICKNVMRNIGLKYTELIAFFKIEETKPYFQYEKYVNWIYDYWKWIYRHNTFWQLYMLPIYMCNLSMCQIRKRTLYVYSN